MLYIYYIFQVYIFENVVPALVVRTEVVAEMMAQGRGRGNVAVMRSRKEGPRRYGRRKPSRILR